MVRKMRTHVVGGDSATPSEFRPKHLTKQEFGRRLYNVMLAKGWHQSELARQSGLPRDSVSTYIRGKTLPTPNNLQALAKALTVEPEALLPNHIESAIDEDEPAFEIRASAASPGKAWLRANRLVSFTTAVKIAELLEADDAVTKKDA